MTQWKKIAEAEGLPAGEGKTIEVLGKTVALFNDGGCFRAIDNTCPHRGASLGEGKLKDHCVVCPWHQWTFCLESGENIRNPAVKLATYPVRLEKNEIWICI